MCKYVLHRTTHLPTHPPTPPHAPQSAKQKAVLDLLRELRQQGLGAGATPAVRALRDPVALAHAPAPFALEGLLVLPAPSSSKGDAAAVASTKPPELTARVGEAWRRAERYHAKGLAEMMALRADALKQSPHRDVPAAQVCLSVCLCVCV